MFNAFKSLVLASLFVSTASFAGNYTLPAHVIAQSSQGGGLAPISAPASWGVRIFDNGKVSSYSIYHDGRIVEKSVAVLTPDRVKAILANVKDLADSDLVNPEPNQPMCTDYPGLTYLARNGQGQAVALAGAFGCRDYVRADGATTPVTGILQSLRSLSNL